MDNSSSESKVCPWCKQGIRRGQPTLIVDGDLLHLPCAAEEDESSTFDRDMGFGDS